MKKIIFNIILLCFLLAIYHGGIANLRSINWVNYSPNIENKKFYAIEFWATWCVPCITSLPKIEGYQKKYPEILFIALSKENLKVIKKFLEKRKITIPIGQDIDNYWHNKLKITYYPTLVLLDTSYNVIFKEHPSRLNDDFLDSLLIEYKHIQPKGKSKGITIKGFTNDTVFSFIFKKSYNKKYTANYFTPGENSVHFGFTNFKLKDIIISLLNVQKNSLLFEMEEDTSNYDFYGLLSDYEIENVKKIVLDFLCSLFQIKIKTTTIPVKGYEIVINDKTKLKGFKVNPIDYENVQHYSTNDSLCSIANYSLKNLAELISDLFTIDVTYLGKDDNRYNFEFPTNFTLVQKILNDQYGIYLKSAVIKKKLYIVTKK